MKKLNSFLVFFLLMTGMTFAQVNESRISAAGDLNKAEVDQQGSDNQSVISQKIGGNEATVKQINHKLQVANQTLSTIEQTGLQNKAEVTQEHDGNLASQAGKIEAVIRQIGNENLAVQKQGPHSQLGTAFASIFQQGDENFASQNQMKYGNQARILQAGNGNTAMQAQDAFLLPEEEGSMNEAIIEQAGDENTASQEQDGWANIAETYQTGNGNRVVQDQYAWKSTAIVSQHGNDNSATQNQDGRLNLARVEQQSDGNTATQTQVSDGARPNANYTWLNEGIILQQGGLGNTAVQDQYMPAGDLDALSNYAYVMQNGTGNISSQIQDGGYNTSIIEQSGAGNNVTIVQNHVIVSPN